MEYASVVPAVLGIRWLPWWAVVVTVICVIIVAIFIYLLWKFVDSLMQDPSMYAGPIRHTNE
jgi:heme/copper-type cytochrome/quinol oxidase subunit 2